MSALRLSQALAVVHAGLDAAERRGVPSCVAVVDGGGHLFAFAANPAAKLVCRDLAINKAYTALALECRTEDLASSAQPGGDFFGMSTALSTRQIVTFAGGVPLGDPVIGAVGVSGGTLADDVAICREAATVL